MRVYVVYNTDGYTCSKPIAAFNSKEVAKKYAEENQCSGVKRLDVDMTPYDYETNSLF